MKTQLENAKRIVLKIGSALLTDQNSGTLKTDWLESIVSTITQHKSRDQDWLIVSSGAVALGRPALNVQTDKPTSALTLEQKQAAASIGQVRLAQAYSDVFGQQGVSCGQILLSLQDTEDRRSHLNARATIETLLEHHTVPIINENDSIATEEIRFGDNDRLAARVAQMVGADLLILLSTIDGLYDKDPSRYNNAQHFEKVDDINADIMQYADVTSSGISTGGMISKLEAAKIATHAGCQVCIADGRVMSPLTRQERFTLFTAKETPEKARKRWIRAHLNPCGEIIIDSGAVKALEKGKSLLPVGVQDVIGDFSRGDPVLIKDMDKRLIARGLIAYDTNQAKKIAGSHSDSISGIIGFEGRKELIHRDDLVLEENLR